VERTGSDNGQALTPHGASLRVSTTASAGVSRAKLLCPRYGYLYHTIAKEDHCQNWKSGLHRRCYGQGLTMQLTDRIRLEQEDPPFDAQRPQGLRRQQRYVTQYLPRLCTQLTKTVADVDLLLMHNTTFAAEYVRPASIDHPTCAMY
jgi:hypothetical protein